MGKVYEDAMDHLDPVATLEEADALQSATAHEDEKIANGYYEPDDEYYGEGVSWA